MESVLPLVFTAISLFLSVGLPVALIILCVRRGGRSTLRSVGIGAVCFIVGALVLEQMVHAIVLTMAPGFQQNFIGFAAYSTLMAGLFEETARLLGLKWLCKAKPEPLTGFAYGVGHGGIEAILLGGIGAFSNLYTLWQLRAKGAEQVLALYPEEQRSALSASLDQLATMPPALFLASGLERVAAICFHIALSMLIYMVVVKKLPLGYYFLSILLHAGLDCIAACYQGGLITDIWLLEGLVILGAAAVAAFVYRLAKKHDCLPFVPLHKP